MNREIKFKVWDKLENKMLDWGKLVNYCNASRVINWIERLDDDRIVMQYTGLKDKNGREIYEGDVILTGRTTRRTYIIEYRENEGYVGIPCTSKEYPWGGSWLSEFCKLDMYFVEVIGNQFENPELINN